MKNKKISRNVKRRLTFLAPILTIILIFCITSIGSYAYNIYNLKREELKLKEELKNLKEKEEELEEEIIKLKDPEYIAKYARENYYYTKNGEYVIKINEIDDEKDILIKEDTNKSYYVIAIVILILIALIYIFKNTRKRDND